MRHASKTVVFLILLCASLDTVTIAQTPQWASVMPLPAPRGTFRLGVTTLRLVDSTRPTSQHRATRPLTIQIWYPAEGGTGRAPGRYVTEPGLLDSMMQRGYLDLKPDQMKGWGAVEVRAVVDATPAPHPVGQGWPVLVFSHGLGVARGQYSALSQDLASHGYVVLTVDHPIGGFTLAPEGSVLTPGVDSLPYSGDPLGSVARDWARDAAFVVRQLAASRVRIDTTRVGFLGHSIGGAAALQACRTETLFKACVDMDGHPFGDVEEQGVGRPFLTLLSQPDRRKQAPPHDSAEASRRLEFARMGRERDSLWAAIVARQPGIPAYVVRLRGTGHMSFSDAPFQAPSLLRNVGATLSPLETYRVVSNLLLDFFDHFLRGRPLRSAHLRGLAG